MPSKARATLRYLSGRFTPFLDPWMEWKPDEDPADEGARDRLEAYVERHTGALTVRALSSGREAIFVALGILNMAPGKGVILPSFGCRALLAPIVAHSRQPIYVDVTRELNIDLENLKQIPARTAGALIVPHLGGLWTRDMDRILDWAADADIAIIEDVAHSHGLLAPRVAGAFGSVSICSTGVGKVLFGPGGGWLAAHDKSVAARLDSLELSEQRPPDVAAKLHNFVEEFFTPRPTRGRRILKRAFRQDRRSGLEDSLGSNAISVIESRVALHQLDRLEAQIRARRRNASRWKRLLDQVEIRELRTAPLENNLCLKYWAAFDGDRGPAKAHLFRRILFRSGVETESLYVPLHKRFSSVGVTPTPLSGTEAVEGRVFSLPARANLTEVDWGRIERAVVEAAEALS